MQLKSVAKLSVVLSLGIAVLVGCGTETEVHKGAVQVAVERNQQPNHLTKVNYDSFETSDVTNDIEGMTYEEAVEMFGQPVNETYMKDGTREVYWEHKESSEDIGNSLSITFENNHANGKIGMNLIE